MNNRRPPTHVWFHYNAAQAIVTLDVIDIAHLVQRVAADIISACRERDPASPMDDYVSQVIAEKEHHGFPTRLARDLESQVKFVYAIAQAIVDNGQISTPILFRDCYELIIEALDEYEKIKHLEEVANRLFSPHKWNGLNAKLRARFQTAPAQETHYIDPTISFAGNPS